MIVPKTLLPHASFLPLRLIPPYGLESLVLDGTLITTRDTTRFTPAHYVRESRKEGRMTDRREARPAWSIR